MSLVLNDQSTIMCSHGGRVQGTPSPRVKAGGAPVLTGIPHFRITGCSNPPPPANSGPCVMTLSLAGGTTRVRVHGLSVMTERAVFSPGVPGAGVVTVVSPGQVRVKAL